MIFDLSGGAGGVRLNFKIVAYKSESELLNATPQENTIGVVTTTKFSSWILSHTEPSSPEPAMVWIKIGGSSVAEFNALKKNGIIIRPLSALQYISGKWTEVDAMIYQNGWKTWFTYLYSPEDECTDLTGGWEPCKYKTKTSNSTETLPTVEKGSTSIKISFNSSGYRAGALFTIKAVDLTDYSTLEIDVESVGTVADTVFVGISENKKNNYDPAARQVIYEKDIGKAVELDVSGFTGAYYVFVSMQGTGTNHIEFSSIRMR